MTPLPQGFVLLNPIAPCSAIHHETMKARQPCLHSRFPARVSSMRDGRDLVAALRGAREGNENQVRAALRGVVDPYLQFVDKDGVCEFTGLRLMDIWRYFRHTWTNEYLTVPGRTMMILVRDRAARNHPVVGIAALASPVVQLNNRDHWIGWSSREFLAHLRKKASASWARWVRDTFDELLTEIYVDDLIRDGVISRRDIRWPKAEGIERLRECGKRARDTHRLYPDAAMHKNPSHNLSDRDWQKRAETNLFRWKRSWTLADLLETKRRLTAAGFKECSKSGLLQLLESAAGRRAIDQLRRLTKGRFVGNNVLEITVCGAVPPYNELLGGKLVAMLLASPQVCQAYASRYGKIASVIASSMAGRAIRRKPLLTVLTTTSLYGAGLSQYTRISVPATITDSSAGNLRVRYEKLGITEGKGSLQFSDPTLREIEVLIRRQKSGPKIHSIFGEGVSPKLRKVRTALELVGCPSDAALTHGSARAIYGVKLATNAREILLGKEKRPKYILAGSKPDEVSRRIVDYWLERWVARRIERDDVLRRIAGHALISPIEHGARVVLPPVYEEEPLFYGMDVD